MIKDDLAYIDHILDCIRKINEFSKGISLKEFKNNELVQDAIIRNIEIIGEAQKKSPKTQNKPIIRFPGRKLLGCATNSSMTIWVSMFLLFGILSIKISLYSKNSLER
jgi:hypothetical protein